MTKILTTTIALGLALALCSPAQAQLMHGGFGGDIGGGLGGGFGGGFGRGIGVGGTLGANGTLDAADGTMRTTTRNSDHATARAPKPMQLAVAPKTTTASTRVATPALSAAPVAPVVAYGRGHGAVAVERVAQQIGTARSVVVAAAPHVVFVPAIPDYAVRRAAIVETGIAPIAYADAPAYIDTQYQVLQNDLRGTGVDVTRRGQQIVLEMPSDVTFAFNKYDIQPRFRPVLDAVSHTLSKYPATYVDVDGHTDAIGSLAYNQTLSEKRAFSVADYLTERAVNGARLHVEGFGKTEPIASNATVTGRAANRRVEIVLTPYVG